MHCQILQEFNTSLQLDLNPHWSSGIEIIFAIRTTLNVLLVSSKLDG